MAINAQYMKTFTKKLYRFLEDEHQIKLKKLNAHVGSMEYIVEDPGLPCTITLDFRKDILSTLIHEFLHYRHQTWSESEILKSERLIMNRLTSKQAKNILKKLAQVL